MRDEQPGEPLEHEQPLQLGLHLQPGDLVEGAERLVEQGEIGLGDSARAIDTRIRMPPDSCRGMLLLEPGEADQLEHLLRPRRGAPRFDTPRSSGTSSTLRAALRHSSSVGSWKT